MNKELKSLVNDLDFASLRELFAYIKPLLAEKRAAARERAAELKAELAGLRETRNRGGAAEESEDKPKKKKKKKNRE